MRIAQWLTDIQFNFNSPVFADTEIIGAGDSAYLQAIELADNIDNITFDDALDFDANPNIEIIASSARIKGSGESNEWPYTIPGNYTFDGGVIEFLSGKSQLKDLRPANATFYCNYNSKNGNWGKGVLKGKLQNGAAVTGGLLDVTGGVGRSCDYDSANNADIPNVGCIRIGIIPQYSGNPADYQILIFLGTNGTFNNSIYIFHDPAGPVYVAMYDNAGILIMAHNCGNWNPVSGQEYEFELNYNIILGQTRLFIDGTLKGLVATQTGTHNNFDIIRIGNSYNSASTANMKINYICIFDMIQHTVNYTPGGEAGITETIYDTNCPVILTDLGFAYTNALNTFLEISAKPSGSEIKHQLTIDDGVSFLYWDSLAWSAVPLTSENPPDAVRLVLGTLLAGNLFSLQSLDANTYNVQEINATPGFLIEMDFVNILNVPDQITIYGYYFGNPTHIVNVDIYNYQTTAWDTLGVIPNSGEIITQYDYPVTGNKSDYIDNKTVLIRIDHISNGVSSHLLSLDYVFCKTVLSTEEACNNYSNTAVEINTNINTIGNPGTIKIKSFLDSDGNANPQLDRLFVQTPQIYPVGDFEIAMNYDIVPTQIQNWLTVVETVTKPVNTNILYKYSVDSGVVYNGTWLTAMQLQTAIIGIAEPEKIRIKFQLSTTDFLVSPVIDNLTITSEPGVAQGAVYISGKYEISDIFVEKIKADLILPEDTTILLEVRTFEKTIIEPTDWIVVEPESSFQLSGDFLQWRATFTSTNGESAKINEVLLYFDTSIGLLGNISKRGIWY